MAYLHGTYGNLIIGFVSKEAAATAHALTGWPFFDDAVLEVCEHEDLIQTANMVGSGAAYSYFGDFELVEDRDAVGGYEWLAALEGILGDRPSVQGGICQHCRRDYSGDILEGDCQSDDCPSFKARAAMAKARGAP